jgi:hypothetical protein
VKIDYFMGVRVEVSRKRDQVDDKLEMGARLKLEATSDTDDLQGNIQVMQTALNGTPTLKMIVEMIEELHVRGAYLDFICVRRTRMEEIQQVLLMGITYQQNLNNLVYYLANEILCQFGEQQPHDPCFYVDRKEP